jgi:hypothetical protein
VRHVWDNAGRAVDRIVAIQEETIRQEKELYRPAWKSPIRVWPLLLDEGFKSAVLSDLNILCK